MARMSEGEPSKRSRNRKGIKQPEVAVLWAASAGRCNICNTSLLRDATTALEVKTGEMAHIVGVADTPRSPRGQNPLPRRQRDKAANLILLCEKHHTEVDKRPDVYTTQHLREIKCAFEERVFYLTGLTEEQQTLVLRIVGDIHGQKVPDISREHAREIVLREQGRYPRFELSATEHDASIDLRPLTNEGSADYWNEASRQIVRRVQHLRELQAAGVATHVSVFALARIPVLVMLGDAIGDAMDSTVYHRRNQEGWGWDRDADVPRFEVVKHESPTATDDVALMCSLAASVRLGRADEQALQGHVYEIRPVKRDPGHTSLDHPEALGAFAKTYREFLSIMEESHPVTRTLHLLPAVPTDAAVTLGQIRTPATTPSLRVYDLDRATDRYVYACEVGS